MYNELSILLLSVKLISRSSVADMVEGTFVEIGECRGASPPK